jgi:alpha-glucoside transport system permease protein
MRDPLVAVLCAGVGLPALLAGYLALTEAGLHRLRPGAQQALRPWVWLAPALVFLAAFLVVPAAETVRLSLLDPRSGAFVGLRHYAFVFTDGEMRVALRNNVVWLVGFAGLTVSAGLAMALLVDRVRYRAAATSALFLPMAVSFVAAGVVWKFVYEFRPAGAPQIGLLNALWLAVRPDAQPVAWLVDPAINTPALIGVGVWVWAGFCLVIFAAALRSVPAEILDAARVDGAGEWQLAARVILPLLGPTVAVVATTMVIFALKAFDIVYVMTNGNFGTEVIASRMYKEMFTFRHAGRASAIAVVLFAATAPVMAANIRRYRRQEAAR